MGVKRLIRRAAKFILESSPEFYSKLGVSEVLVHSPKGVRLLDMARKLVEIIPISLEEAMAKQGNLKRPTARTAGRDDFYAKLDDPDFIDGLRIGACLKERLKTILPAGVVRFIKRYIDRE